MNRDSVVNSRVSASSTSSGGSLITRHLEWNPLFDLPKWHRGDLLRSRVAQLNSCLYDVESTRIRRAVTLSSGMPVLVDIPTTAEDNRSIQYYGSVEDVEEVTLAVRRMLSLAWPYDSLYAHLLDVPPLASLASHLRGYCPITHPDAWESLASAVISQQLNLRFAATLSNRLIERIGDTMVVDGRSYPVFPSPAQIAQCSVEELREWQFSRMKASYLIGTAQAVLQGDLDFAQIDRVSDDEALLQLMALRGVGRWTAECLLMNMGRADLLPAADIGIRNGITSLYGLDHQASEDEVRTYAEAWRPYRSYICQYIWGSQLLPVVKTPGS